MTSSLFNVCIILDRPLEEICQTTGAENVIPCWYKKRNVFTYML